MRRFLLRFLFGTLVLIVLLAGTVMTVWMRPDLILTDSRVKKLLDYLPVEFSKKPDTVHLKLLPSSLYGKDVQLEMSSFCLKDPRTCFDKVEVNFRFHFTKLTHVEVQSLGLVTIQNQFFEIPKTPEKKPPEKASRFDLGKYVSLSPEFKIRDVDIEFPKIILPGEPEQLASLQVRAKDEKQIEIDAGMSGEKGIQAKAQIHSAFITQGSSPVDATFQVSKKWTVTGSVKGNFIWKTLGIHLGGEVEARKLVPWIDTLYLKDIQFSRDPSLSFSANILGKLEPRVAPLNPDSALPKAKLGSDLLGKVSIQQNQDHYPYLIELGPIRQKGMVLNLNAKGDYPKSVEHFLFELKIPEFQKLVQGFSRTNTSIPAPFHTMAGSIDLKVGSEQNLAQATQSFQEVPILFTTRLKSQDQELNTESKGSLAFNAGFSRFKLNGESDVKAIRFTLPKFELLENQVTIVRDSRIISNKKTPTTPTPTEEQEARIKEKKDETFSYSWKINSNKDALRVFYPVLVPSAPIQVSWLLSSEHSEGELKLLPFEIHYMNREAKVDSFRFWQKPEAKTSHYHGKLIIPKTEYTISIEVLDEYDKPKVILQSDPPLSEDDIVSVLLFNQTSEELTPDESSSVANTQAAVENRALGLFSIWALSSTPIEAVAYNPSTHVYSARVKLANGLTATIGTNWENSQEVALRKRLGRNFVLSTIVETDKDAFTGETTETTKALIEWLRRF